MHEHFVNLLNVVALQRKSGSAAAEKALEIVFLYFRPSLLRRFLLT